MAAILPKKNYPEEESHAATHSLRYFASSIPKNSIPEESMPANAAYQLCHDELNLDGNPYLNLASFVTTWMEPEAEKLIMETLNKNLVDEDEYPQSVVIEQRCVRMVADLFHAPSNGNPIGTATIGSSEAIMLAALSHKWNWKQAREKQGLSTNKPNIVMGADIQIVWDKFARYFDVEPKIIPMHPERYTLSKEEVKAACDENTICVVAVLGTTFTGEFDPFEDINQALEEIKKEKGWDIPLHIDAASGGFVAPFVCPKLKWDFRLSQVKSINVSGHKFGLVYPGIGWVVWKDRLDLPKELVFNVNYLGGEMPTFNLNFSRGSSHVIAQYYNFLRLGREGYTAIMKNLMSNATFLRRHLEELGNFEVLGSEIGLPVVTVKLKDDSQYTVFDLSHELRAKGWIVPAYTMPPNAEHISVLRFVIRESFSHDMAELLIRDIQSALKALKKKGSYHCKLPPYGEQGKHIC